MIKSLDAKLAEIRSNPASNAFVLADAKDADMAFGLASTGPASPEMHGHEFEFRSVEEYRQAMRNVTAQAAVDIMLMSASNAEQLVLRERLFDNSPVTPAARANDTTDIFALQGGTYLKSPSRPFRTASIDHMQCGKAECEPGERGAGVNLGLYSLTFNNNLERDLETLKAFKEFRVEAERKNFRYFLEVFSPNMPGAVDPDDLGRFIYGSLVRSLAGVTERGRPLFLKVAYLGPKAMEELVHYDPNLVVGIMGGSAGTTYDAFKLLAEARKYGARAALFGRKINNSEHQLAFVQFLRMIADGEISPEKAVPAYHGVLKELGIHPNRSLEEDLQLTDSALQYVSDKTLSYSPRLASRQSPARELRGNDAPDFENMTPQQKIDWGLQERKRIMGD